MSQSHKRRFGYFLLTTVACVIAFSLGGAATTTRRATGSWPDSQTSQLVFFAVLEGLYRDGVSNKDVDLIIPPGEKGGEKFEPEHFVYACPLCHPAFEAFRLYRHRQRFYGLKAEVNTFGPGLAETVAASLRSPDPSERRQAVEGLVARWVSQRLEMMRLTDAEREAMTRAMEQGRKQGMNSLKNGSLTR